MIITTIDCVPGKEIKAYQEMMEEARKNSYRKNGRKGRRYGS